MSQPVPQKSCLRLEISTRRTKTSLQVWPGAGIGWRLSPSCGRVHTAPIVDRGADNFVAILAWRRLVLFLRLELPKCMCRGEYLSYIKMPRVPIEGVYHKVRLNHDLWICE